MFGQVDLAETDENENEKRTWKRKRKKEMVVKKVTDVV